MALQHICRAQRALALARRAEPRVAEVFSWPSVAAACFIHLGDFVRKRKRLTVLTLQSHAGGAKKNTGASPRDARRARYLPVIEGELADGSGVFCLVMGEDGAVLYLGDEDGWAEEQCEAAPDGDEVVVTIAGEPAYRITFTDTVPVLL